MQAKVNFIDTGNIRAYRMLALFLLLLPLLFLLDILVGSYSLSITDVITSIFNPSAADSQVNLIIQQFRIPKAITAVLAGAALSVAGLQMQTVFRNPLAGPFVLGVSSGASLGVALLVMGTGTFLGSVGASFTGSWGIVIAAWMGAAIILIVIAAISVRVKEIMTILILGILISSAISSVVTILQYFSNESMLKSFVVWTMGSLGSVTSTQLAVLIPSVIIGLILALLVSKQLDLFLLGENYARSMGMNVSRSRLIIFLSTCILSGSITAFCGPIGFIGIAVPHIARMWLKTASHLLLTPATILIGAHMMLISDIVSQLPGTQTTLPVNSVTALLGIPVVIWIILKNNKGEL